MKMCFYICTNLNKHFFMGKKSNFIIFSYCNIIAIWLNSWSWKYFSFL